MDQRFPTLCSHLTKHGVNVSSMALNWFLTMFVTSLPLECTLRVWDVLFFDRCASVLFRCGLALVDIYAQVCGGLALVWHLLQTWWHALMSARAASEAGDLKICRECEGTASMHGQHQRCNDAPQLLRLCSCLPYEALILPDQSPCAGAGGDSGQHRRLHAAARNGTHVL